MVAWAECVIGVGDAQMVQTPVQTSDLRLAGQRAAWQRPHSGVLVLAVGGWLVKGVKGVRRADEGAGAPPALRVSRPPDTGPAIDRIGGRPRARQARSTGADR